MVRWITRAILVVFVTLLIIFWLLPAAQRTTAVTWGGASLITVCAFYLSFAYHRPLATWRGFGALAAVCFATLAWLRWRPLTPLPWSSFPLLQNANTVVGLLAWASLIAVFISSVLLLIRKDASVALMGLAWVLVPLILLAVGAHYGRMEHLRQAPLGEQTFWGVPLVWAITMLCLGPPAFLIHYAILLIKELDAR